MLFVEDRTSLRHITNRKNKNISFENYKKALTKLPNESAYYTGAGLKKVWSSGNLKLLLDFLHEKIQKEQLSSLLEIGCGKAEIFDVLPPGIIYTGLEPSEKCVAELKLKHPQSNFVISCAEEVPFSDNSFDFVFSGHAFEHFYDPKKSIAEMIRVVKPSGYIVLMAPNLEAPWAKIGAVRHYSVLNKIIFGLGRWADLVLRVFGVLSFRLIKQNYTKATGKYEHADDDLMSVTSTYEVVSLFKQNGLRKVFVDSFIPKDHSIKSKVRSLLTQIPVLRYYGVGIFVIFQKP